MKKKAIILIDGSNFYFNYLIFNMV